MIPGALNAYLDEKRAESVRETVYVDIDRFSSERTPLERLAALRELEAGYARSKAEKPPVLIGDVFQADPGDENAE